ncbi:hypothetical protein S7335_567 [Synechococcus sp. PCC 7335]|nr:hypothetical protein S7335_567 [Synechococcus sp. PCC 7335]
MSNFQNVNRTLLTTQPSLFLIDFEVGTKQNAKQRGSIEDYIFG